MCAMITSSMADTLFGNKNTVGTGGFLSASSFGDLSMIKSGVYTRMLRSYYEKYGSDNKTESKSESNAYVTDISTKLESLQGNTTSTILSDVKSAAGTLAASAKEVSQLNVDTGSRDDWYASVKKMTDSYNAVLSGADKSDVVSINQSVAWMKGDTKMMQSELKNIGITIGTDGKLSVDKEAFQKADLNSIQEVFGEKGYAAKISQKASGIQTLAANQMSYYSGKTFYSASGVLGQ